MMSTSAPPSEPGWTCATSTTCRCCAGHPGTLFGRNTIGGAILMSTADPGDRFGGAARGGFGSDKLFDGFLAQCAVVRRFEGSLHCGSPQARRLRHSYG